MAEAIAFSGNHFIPAGRLNIAVNDAGFVWGATVTDLCRTFRQRLYRWQDHLTRFRHSCHAVHIDVALSDTQITEAAATLVAQNSQLLTADQELMLVLLASPGLIGYYTGQENSGPTFNMHTFPLPYQRYRRLFEQGAKLLTPHIRPVPALCIPTHIKQRSRLHWWLAEHEVHQQDAAASALLVNEEGLVTETAFANFLAVRGDDVLAPPAELVLPGVSQRVISELCAEIGLGFREQPVRLADCLSADEAMLCGTAFCLAGVRTINAHEMKWPGPVFERLLAAWSAKVGVDIRRQICGG